MTQNNFLYRINQICAVFMVIWVCWPWFGQNTGLIGGVFFAGGWCTTCVLLSHKRTIGFDGMLMLLYGVIMILSYLLRGRLYGDFQLYYYLSMVSLFFLPYYMQKFYLNKNDQKFMGKIAIIAIIFMIIGAGTSIYHTEIDPNIMKTISQSMDTELVEYRKIGIGSFGFIYMLMFAIITIIGQFKTHTLSFPFWIKMLLIVFCLTGIKCIIDSTFTTALILLVIGIVLILISKKNDFGTNVIIFLFVLVSIFFISRMLGEFLINITLESEDVTIRLREIGRLLLGESSGTNTDIRFKYFIRSVNCFMKYPLLGYNFAASPDIHTGGHSEWIDIFAVYGLIGGIPLTITIIYKLRNTAKKMKKNMNYPYYPILIFIFVIYGFIDPFLRLYHLGFVMFLFIPCIACISKAFVKKDVKT